MVTNYTVTDFTPVDAPLYTTPIQVTGHSVLNLTVARTPDNQAIFGWTDDNTGIYYCYVDPDFNKVYEDDVCPDGSERVVFDKVSEGWTVITGSLWVDRGQLFCALSLLFAPPGVNNGYSICYIADDVENPTSWSQRGIIDQELGNSAVIDIHSAGPPLILTTGRWVMPFASWGGFATGISDRSSIVVSDDMGVDWSVVYSHRRDAGSGGTTGPISDTIGQDPLTGYLYWSHYDGPIANEAFILRSMDSGSTWTVIDSNAATTWNFMVDNGVDLLYATAATGGGGGAGWIFYNTDGDPDTEASYIDTTLRSIPSNQAGYGFQSHVFLDHGSIAFVDINRIAGYFFPPQGCPIPDPLHIPYKDRLLMLEVDDTGKPDPASYDLMSDHDFDNLKTIERWAANWMADSQANHGAPESCELFIPYKDHLRHAGRGARKLDAATQRAISSMSFDNYKVIERWAARVTGGECACEGPSKCQLHIPFKDAALAITASDDGELQGPLESAGQRDFDNYKRIEQWANMNARAECGDGGGFPPTPFPEPPNSPVRFSGEMMEVSTFDSASVRIAGEMMEVSTQDDTTIRFHGEMMEVAVILP